MDDGIDVELNADVTKGEGSGRCDTQHHDNAQDSDESLDQILKDLFDTLDAQVHSAIEVRLSELKASHLTLHDVKLKKMSR